MTRIKSAWEIALERAQGIKVTPEELRRQLEEKCQLAGAAIAERFLNVFDLKQLKEDLEKQSGEEGELVKKAAVEKLAGSLELGDYEKMEKIIEGISLAAGDEKINAAKGRFYVLYDSYHNALAKKRSEIEAAGRKMLERLGISGEAVRAVNARVNKEWAQDLKNVTRPYEKEFELYKKELLA